MPGKSRNKKKSMKLLTPLQAMMLSVDVQEIPEEGQDLEEFSEDNEDDSKAEKQSQKLYKKDFHSDGTATASQNRLSTICSSFLRQALPIKGHHLLALGPPLWCPGPPTFFLPGTPAGNPSFLRLSKLPGLQGPLSTLLSTGPPLDPSPGLLKVHLHICFLALIILLATKTTFFYTFHLKLAR
jgi:WW domain-binding protein 11